MESFFHQTMWLALGFVTSIQLMAGLMSRRCMVASYRSRRSAMYISTFLGIAPKPSRAKESFGLSIRRFLFADDNSLGRKKLNRRCDGSDIEASKNAI
jgi:hypothetical protein